jgi:hypothetical protein
MSAMPDPSYLALTEKALQEDQAHLRAYEEKERAAQPPPQPPLPAEQQAAILRDGAAAAYLYGATAAVLGRGVSLPGCQLYLGDLMREAGSPADPVEQMLLEQLALAHHAIGQLHVRAGASQTAEAAEAYAGAAARLLAEFRRTSLALKAYRNSPPRPEPARAPPRRRKPRAGANGNVAAARKNGVVCELGNSRITGYFSDEPALP